LDSAIEVAGAKVVDSLRLRADVSGTTMGAVVGGVKVAIVGTDEGRAQSRIVGQIRREVMGAGVDVRNHELFVVILVK
jgi:outer membrane lipoprotein SlyB